MDPPAPLPQDLRGDLDRIAVSAPAGLGLRVAPIEIRLVSESDTEADVDVWVTQIISGAGSVRVDYSTITITLTKVEGHWLLADMGSRPGPVPDLSVTNSYEALLSEGSAMASRHEVLVTVTVHTRKVSLRKRHGKDQQKTAIESLLREMELFTMRLGGAGLQVSAMLSPSSWARAMRLRLYPGCRLALDTRTSTFGTAAGAIDPANATPMATDSDWEWWRTDGAFHRAMYVADWPRMDQPASWMSPLMLWSDSVRSISCFFEPVPRFRSFSQITRAAGKIQSDEDSRRKDGWRVGAHHRRAKQAVDEREEELVAGYGEFYYAGVVTVTAATVEALEEAADRITQKAAGIGIDLRPLHGRHDEAVCAGLPIARALKPKMIL